MTDSRTRRAGAFCRSRSEVIGFSLQNRSAVLGRRDVVPVEVELQQDLLGVLPVFGRPRWRRRSFIELHWGGHDSVLVTLVVDVGDDVTVRLDLGIVEGLLR